MPQDYSSKIEVGLIGADTSLVVSIIDALLGIDARLTSFERFRLAVRHTDPRAVVDRPNARSVVACLGIRIDLVIVSPRCNVRSSRIFYTLVAASSAIAHL